MAVQKTNYSLNPPWTYDELIQKYYEILGTLGVYGTLVDSFPSPNSASYTAYVYKRTHQPSESPAARFPDIYVSTWAEGGIAYRLNWVTNDGSWNTDTHRFVPGTDPGEGSFKTYYNTGANTHYSTNYRQLFWDASANTNELLPIYLYRSQEDPNYWWLTIDNGDEGVAYYEPSSSVQFDPMVAIDQLYCFPTYRIGSDGTGRIYTRNNGQHYGLSWTSHGRYDSSYIIYGSSNYARYQDLDSHYFGPDSAANRETDSFQFSMPNIYEDINVEATPRLTLVRGAKWTNWLKNKLIPNDFALLVDPGITSQTRVGQPYIINGKTYEVVKASSGSSTPGMFLVAQITD